MPADVKPLSDERVETFHEQGYVFLPEFFSEAEVETFRDETDRILELIVNSSLANDRTSGRLDLKRDEDGNQTVRQINPSLDLSRVFKDLAVNEIADLLRPIQKDDPVSVDQTAQLNYKMPLPEPTPLEAELSDDRYAVHADWPYYEGYFPPGIITSIVFLDDVGEDSGPLEVWPETHTKEIEHVQGDFGLEASPDVIDHDAGEPLLGPAGSALLFDSRMIHSSGPNVSDMPRRFAIFGHAPGSNIAGAQVSDGSARPETVNKGVYPRELIESTYEGEYYRKKRQGEFEDRFESPSFYD